MRKKTNLLAIIGPGILVAATGVGAGDLATATFTGTKLGTAILWAVVVGAFLKYVLNEGLTRWQLATETTLLEGCVAHLGRWVQWLFLVYLVIWSYLVAMALMSACGVAAESMFPLFADPENGKIFYGMLHSVIAMVLVRIGGYELFSKVMNVCIAVMFAVVVLTAIALRPAWGQVLSGMLIPTIPEIDGEGLQWTLALLGGVGGTVTVLCYGYWIREVGRDGVDDLKLCRVDLAVGYAMTALFGISMIVIGHELGEVPGSGARLIVNVADTLKETFGQFGIAARWAFLVGAWGAFFSSLLGVWQSVPYLFADFWGMMGNSPEVKRGTTVDTQGRAYVGYLAAIGIVPISGLFVLDFQSAVKVYAIVGAVFLPMLAAALLYLNGRQSLVGQYKNSRWTSAVLVLTLLFFLVTGGLEVVRRIS